GFMLLEIELARDWMVRLMDLDHQIADRELQLMHPEPACFVPRRKTMAQAQIEQDICGLRDHELAGLENWRRKRRTPVALAHQQSLDRLAPRSASHIGVVRACLF